MQVPHAPAPGPRRRARGRARTWLLTRPGWPLLRGAGDLQFTPDGTPALRLTGRRWEVASTVLPARRARERDLLPDTSPDTVPDAATARVLAAGTATRAGWFFSGLPLPVEDLPIAPDVYFVVHIDLGRSGFRVGGRPVSVRMLGQAVRHCPDWKRRQLVLCAGTVASEAVLASTMSSLAGALRVPVISSTGPILLGPRVLIAQQGFVTRSPLGGPATPLGRALPVLKTPGRPSRNKRPAAPSPVLPPTASQSGTEPAVQPTPQATRPQPKKVLAASFQFTAPDLELPKLTTALPTGIPGSPALAPPVVEPEPESADGQELSTLTEQGADDAVADNDPAPSLPRPDDGAIGALALGDAQTIRAIADGSTSEASGPEALAASEPFAAPDIEEAQDAVRVEETAQLENAVPSAGQSQTEAPGAQAREAERAPAQVLEAERAPAKALRAGRPGIPRAGLRRWGIVRRTNDGASSAPSPAVTPAAAAPAPPSTTTSPVVPDSLEVPAPEEPSEPGVVASETGVAEPVGAVLDLLSEFVIPPVLRPASLPEDRQESSPTAIDWDDEDAIAAAIAAGPGTKNDEAGLIRPTDLSEPAGAAEPAHRPVSDRAMDWVEVTGGAERSDREPVRALLGWRYEAHARAVTGVLALQPGLRAVAGRGDLMVGLVAVRAHLAGTGAKVDAVLRGEKIDTSGGFAEIDAAGAALLARCARSGLSCLPAVVGPVFRAGTPDTAQLKRYRTGQRLVEPAFTEARLTPWAPAGSTVEYAIWSSTARRTDRVGNVDGAGTSRVLFAPGTQFVVLDVEPSPDGGPLCVLLRELPVSAQDDERLDQRAAERLRESIQLPRQAVTAQQRVPEQWRHPIGLHSGGSVYALSARQPEGARS